MHCGEKSGKAEPWTRRLCPARAGAVGERCTGSRGPGYREAVPQVYAGKEGSREFHECGADAMDGPQTEAHGIVTPLSSAQEGEGLYAGMRLMLNDGKQRKQKGPDCVRAGKFCSALYLRDDGHDDGVSSEHVAEEAAQAGAYTVGKLCDVVGVCGFELVEDKAFGILEQMAVLLLEHEAP